MRNKYAFCEFWSNVVAFLITKLFYKPARLFRQPIYIRGRKSFIIGNNLTLGHSCRFDLDGKKRTLIVGKNCEFGDNVWIGGNAVILPGSEIGFGCIIGANSVVRKNT